MSLGALFFKLKKLRIIGIPVVETKPYDCDIARNGVLDCICLLLLLDNSSNDPYNP